MSYVKFADSNGMCPKEKCTESYSQKFYRAQVSLLDFHMGCVNLFRQPASILP